MGRLGIIQERNLQVKIVFSNVFPLRYCYDCIFLPISTGGLSSSLKKKQTINHESVMYWHWQHCHAAVVSSNFCHLLSLLFHHCYSCQKTKSSLTLSRWHVQKIPSLLISCLTLSCLTCSENSIIVIPVKRQSQTWLCLVDMFRKFHHCYSCLTSSCLTCSGNSIIVIPIKWQSQAQGDGKASLKQQKLLETTTDTEDVCKFYVWNVHI